MCLEVFFFLQIILKYDLMWNEFAHILFQLHVWTTTVFSSFLFLIAADPEALSDCVNRKSGKVTVALKQDLQYAFDP